MAQRIFRGKVYHYDQDCGWVYGCLHNEWDGGSFFTLITNIDGENAVTNSYNVVAGSVSQSTGIKDKNGKEIFENDILIDREISEDGIDISSYCPVLYNEATGSYCIDNSYYKNIQHLVNMVEYFGVENLEVVGNTIDNKDLLPKLPELPDYSDKSNLDF